MQWWRGGLGASVASFCSHIFAKMRTWRLKETSTGWVYRASEKSGVKLSTNRSKISTHKHTPETTKTSAAWQKCSVTPSDSRGFPLYLTCPAFKTLHPSTALLTSVLQTPKPLKLTGNQDDPQAADIHIEIEPLIQTLSFDFHLSPSDLLHVMINDVKTCAVSPGLRSLHSLCVLLVKALPLWGWRKAFSLQDFVNCWK